MPITRPSFMPFVITGRRSFPNKHVPFGLDGNNSPHAQQNREKKYPNKLFSSKRMAPRSQAKTLLSLSRNVVSVRATRFNYKIPMGPHSQNPPQNPNKPSVSPPSPSPHLNLVKNGGSASEFGPETTPLLSIFTRSLHAHFVPDRLAPVFELRPPWLPEMEGGFRRVRVGK